MKRFGDRTGIQTGFEHTHIGELVCNANEPKPRTIYKIVGYNKKTHNYRCVKEGSKAVYFIFAEDALFVD